MPRKSRYIEGVGAQPSSRSSERHSSKRCGSRRWEEIPAGYTLIVSDPDLAAPTVARALVRAGADIQSLGESHHSLEPVLTTPIRREEFLVAKALAAFVPTLVIAYAIFGIFLALAALFAHPVIVSAIYAGSHVLVQLLFTPLLAGWAIWVGIAVSTRSTDVRVAQQLSVLGSLPPLIVVALMSLNVITESTALAIGFAAALLAFDLLAWRVVAAMFDRERLVTGRHG